MVRVTTKWGAYHEPPYTDEEIEDFYRRTANIVGFTRPGGSRRTTGSSTAAQPEEPPSGEGPGDPDLPPASPSPTAP
jgi:hypothetical protein